jgi:hypothetical protein
VPISLRHPQDVVVAMVQQEEIAYVARCSRLEASGQAGIGHITVNSARLYHPERTSSGLAASIARTVFLHVVPAVLQLTNTFSLSTGRIQGRKRQAAILLLALAAPRL